MIVSAILVSHSSLLVMLPFSKERTFSEIQINDFILLEGCELSSCGYCINEDWYRKVGDECVANVRTGRLRVVPPDHCAPTLTRKEYEDLILQ